MKLRASSTPIPAFPHQRGKEQWQIFDDYESKFHQSICPPNSAAPDSASMRSKASRQGAFDDAAASRDLDPCINITTTNPTRLAAASEHYIFPGTNESPEQSKGHFLRPFCWPGQKWRRRAGPQPRDFDFEILSLDRDPTLPNRKNRINPPPAPLIIKGGVGACFICLSQ